MNQSKTLSDIFCPACNSKKCEKREKISSHELRACENCGTWFYEIKDSEDVPNYNDVYNTLEYQETHLTTLREVKNWRIFANYDTFRPFFNNLRSPVGRLLDIGCGVGRFCRAAYTMGWSVRGIDISETAIAVGRIDAPFEMNCGTIDDVIKTGEKYETITCFEVLEHLSDPFSFIKKTKGLIKNNGVFFCTVPNLDCESVKNSERKDWIPPIHVTFFNKNSLRMMLERAGFVDVVVGEVIVNEPPKNILKKYKYYIRRAFGQIGKPEALGLWAMGKNSSKQRIADYR